MSGMWLRHSGEPPSEIVDSAEEPTLTVDTIEKWRSSRLLADSVRRATEAETAATRGGRGAGKAETAATGGGRGAGEAETAAADGGGGSLRHGCSLGYGVRSRNVGGCRSASGFADLEVETPDRIARPGVSSNRLPHKGCDAAGNAEHWVNHVRLGAAGDNFRTCFLGPVIAMPPCNYTPCSENVPHRWTAISVAVREC